MNKHFTLKHSALPSASSPRGVPQHGKSQAVSGWAGTIGMGGVTIKKRERERERCWSLSTNCELFNFLVSLDLFFFLGSLSLTTMDSLTIQRIVFWNFCTFVKANYYVS